jgi:adenylate cyclase
MTAARRLAAILAADVGGYSRLMGEDEAGTALSVREHREAARPIIAGLGGRIVKTTGDGLLLEFPSVVAATECAIAIQKLMAERNAGTPEAKRILYRIGVNLGDVLIDGDDILGDGVNIAARLESICEPGGLLLSSSAYDQVRGKIDANFADLGEKDLKNIARPVRAYALKVGGPIALQSAAPAPTSPMTIAPPPASLKSAGREARRAEKASDPLRSFRRTAIVLFLIAAAGWRFVASHPITWGANPPAATAASTVPAATQAAPANAERFSIVVLPFANLSGDPAQDYLADALTDELTTYIAQLGGTFVIARNTAFTYKGKPFDMKEIGKDLGVKYALEGSVQPTPNGLRVNAQLIDTGSGGHVWAESFDEDRTDLLQMEDDIVTRLARTVGIRMISVEAARAAKARPGNPDAQDLALRCIAPLLNNPEASANPSKHPEIYEPCERALSIDPHNTLAMAVLSTRLLQRVTLGEIADAAAEANRFDQLATEALAINPNDQDAHMVKASAAFMRGSRIRSSSKPSA